jgi:hypothetical protein
MRKSVSRTLSFRVSTQSKALIMPKDIDVFRLTIVGYSDLGSQSSALVPLTMQISSDPIQSPYDGILVSIPIKQLDTSLWIYETSQPFILDRRATESSMVDSLFIGSFTGAEINVSVMFEGYLP